MAGKPPPEAVINFLDPLTRALSCVTREVVSVRGGYHVAIPPHALLFQNNPVVLGQDKRFALKLIQQYRIVEDEEPGRGPWKVSTVAYYYTLETPETSAAPSQEVLGYHWHPQERNAVTYPHLHLYQGAGTLRHNLIKAHLPTARVAVEDVLRCVITQLGVVPLRDDWEAILTETQSAFQQWRTWGGSHPPQA
jgi:hypothetical protein